MVPSAQAGLSPVVPGSGLGALNVPKVPRPVLRGLDVLAELQDMSRAAYVRVLLENHVVAEAASLVGELAATPSDGSENH